MKGLLNRLMKSKESTRILDNMAVKVNNGPEDAWRAAVDTGGTFTDICLYKEDSGEMYITKISSTPEDPSRAVMEGIKYAAEAAGADTEGFRLLLHGTTVATNALLEQRGASTALITTRGFRDVLFIGRQNRPHLYDGGVIRPAPLIPRHYVFEVNERVLAGGNIYKALDRNEIISLIRELKKLHVSSVAICLLHSYINPVHEGIIKEMIQEMYPRAMVTLSSEILPEFREFERTCTSVINALVQPVVSTYTASLRKQLKQMRTETGLFIMQSSGGVITARQAAENSARTVLSGPAGGVLAGVFLSRQTGRPNIITADMGGTSMDISLIHGGEPRYTSEGEIGGYPLRLPMLDIHTIGAGGGSIAWVDRGGALRVGPRSAGADPGPACYGLGGANPTVTDANLALGRLNPDAPLGLNQKIDPELARASIEKNIARPLGISVEKAAEGIITVVNAGMARAIRVVSVQRGYDPREFTLMAFGGAGPLHASQLALELNIPHVLIPRHPGVTSALGMLAADLRRDYLCTFVAPLLSAETPLVTRHYADMENRGMEDLAAEGFRPGDISLSRTVDLRYAGQSYEINIPMPKGNLCAGDFRLLEQSFHQAHQREYGSSRDGIQVEIVALRVVATARLNGKGPFLAGGGQVQTVNEHTLGNPPRPGAHRQMYIQGEWLSAPVYRRSHLQPGMHVQGPALIEQRDSTILLLPHVKGHVDRYSNIIMDVMVR